MASFIPVQTQDWTWDISLNWTKNNNKVLSMPDGLEDGKLSIDGLDYVGTSYKGLTLYAVEGPEGYFTVSEPGTITVNDNGGTIWTDDPNGRMHYLKCDKQQQDNILKHFIGLITSKPKNK
jgi:hypothetical protein